MFNTNQLIDRLMMCGITRTESVQIMNLVDRWICLSGLEWTVSHLKLIKQTVLSLYGNNPQGVSPYVRTKNGHLVGPFRAIERLLLMKNDKALSALLFYSSWVSPRLSATQKSKFIKACTAEPYEGEYFPSKEVTEGFKNPFKSRFNSTSVPFGSMQDNTFAPDQNGKSFIATDNKRSAEAFIHTHLYRNLYFENAYYAGGEYAYFTENVIGFTLPKPLGYAPIGKVSVLQEPGLKARFIANPNRVLQHCLVPLGDHLFKIIRNLPWDCTFDQSKPLTVIQRKLAEGHVHHCYDLSNATDYFPLDIQIQVCINLFDEDPRYSEICAYLRLFSEAARSDWFFGSRKIRWTRGQPLGLYPSFALFALSHGYILYELLHDLRIDQEIEIRMKDWKFQCSSRVLPSERPQPPTIDRESIKLDLIKKLGGELYHQEFFILGDDVIILDDELALRYVERMKSIDVPINFSKSTVSSKLAEFAGSLILEDKVYSPYKWRSVGWSSVVPFLKHWGVEGISLLPKHLREWGFLIASLPEPYGLGFNPLGIPMAQRLAHLWEVYLDETLPAFTEVKECLADVLQAMPEGSSLSYYVTPKMARPVLSPRLNLKPYLNPEDVRSFYEELIKRGLLTRDEAIVEIKDSFLFKEDYPNQTGDMVEHHATALVRKQKSMVRATALEEELETPPDYATFAWDRSRGKYRHKTFAEILFGVKDK